MRISFIVITSSFSIFLQGVNSFVPIHQGVSRQLSQNWSRNMVATVEPPVSSPTLENSENPITWECDDNANCVAVSACDEVSCRTSLDVRIHGKWYDLSGTFYFLFFFCDMKRLFFFF